MATIGEAALSSAKGEDKFEFERHEYFLADIKHHQIDGEGKPVFNRVARMKNS